MAITVSNFLTASLNQFTISNVRGMLADWGLNARLMEVTIKSDESADLVPGDPVKLVSSPKGIPTVSKAAGTDAIFGFVIWNNKRTSISAGDKCVVLCDGGVMNMITADALTAGDVLYYKSDASVTKTSFTNAVKIGVAMEDTSANADGSLVRVLVRAVAL